MPGEVWVAYGDQMVPLPVIRGRVTADGRFEFLVEVPAWAGGGIDYLILGVHCWLQ